MAAINSDRCYVLSEPAVIAVDKAPLPEDWLAKLATLCAEKTGTDVSNLKESFEEHAGVNSTYTGKSLLIDGLKEIYYQVTVTGDKALKESEKAAIADKLVEGAANCTPGFHDRANDTVNGFHLPESMDALLGLIRKGIVESTARQTTDEVHAHNRFFVIAAGMGYAVKPINPNDTYRGAVSDEIIRKKISESFAKQYKPLQIYKQLREAIEGVLHSQFGYGHVNEEGYKTGEYEKWLAYLEQIFGMKLKQKDYLLLDEEGRVVNLNWPKVNETLFHYLIDKKYIELTQTETESMNAFLELQYPVEEGEKAKEIDVSRLFTPQGLIPTTSELCSFLALMKNTSYEMQLKLIKAYVDRFTSDERLPALAEIMKATSDKKFITVFKLFIEENYSQDIKAQGSHLEKAVKVAMKNYEQLPLDLRFLSLMDEEQQVRILNIKNSGDRNALMWAFEEQRYLVMSLLEAITQLAPAQQAKILKSATWSGNTPLLEALNYRAQYQYPEAVVSILQVMSNLTITDQVEILSVRNKGFFGHTPLTMALHHPKVATLILTVISRLPPADQVKILTVKTEDGDNALSFAAKYSPEFVAPIVQLIHNLPLKEQEKIGHIQGSVVLPNVLATQSYEDKQKKLNFYFTKFMLALCQQGEEQNAEIQNNFNQLVRIANTHRGKFTNHKGYTASCKDLIKKLSNVGQKEKQQLKESLDLELEGNEITPKAFATALEKYIKSMPKTVDLPSPERDSNSPSIN